MKLGKTELIMVGAGMFYSAPFLSRVFLYRFHDITCSLLIYHDRTHVVSELKHPDMAVKIGGLPAINLGHIVMAKESPKPSLISIHFCPMSCSNAFEDLMTLPARRLSFEDCLSGLVVFDNIGLRIEQCFIPFSNRMIAVYQNREIEEIKIDDAGYTVSGPLAISDWPDTVPKEKLRMHCWRIRLENLESKAKYEIGKSSEWSLAALKVSEDGHLDAAVQMYPNVGTA